MGNTTKPQRNYGLDLLRMFAMFLIAMLHILGQGGVLNAAFSDADKYDAAWLLEIGAYCTVNCYALISGYVGLNSTFRYSGIIMLWLRVLFYTVSITAIFYFVMPQALINSENTKDMFFIISEKWDNALFPVSTKQYWYFTAYFFCYFFTPILNKAVHTLERRQLKRALIAIVGIISIPALYTGNDAFWTSRGYSAIWLIVLYLVGAYMKKYNSFSYIGKFSALYGYFASIILTWTVKIVLTEKLPEFTRPGLLVSYTSPTIIASGIFLFIFFKNLNPPKFFCKIIAFLSPLAFSVYIIHVHPLVWQHLMKDWFRPLADLPTPLMALAVIGAALGLYLACSLIDILRHYLFKLLRLQKLVFAIENKVTEKFAKKEITEETTETKVLSEKEITEESVEIKENAISDCLENQRDSSDAKNPEKEFIKV